MPAMLRRGRSTVLLLVLLGSSCSSSSSSGSHTGGGAMSFADGLLSSIPAGLCLDHHSPGEFWSYRWCHRFNVTQYRGRSHRLKSQEQVLGRFNSGLTSVASSPSFDVTHGFDRGDDCAPAGSRHPPLPRETKVKLMCCSARRDRAKSVHLWSVEEPSPCGYEVRVCVPSLCLTKPAASPVRGAAASSSSGSSHGSSAEAEEAESETEEAEDEDADGEVEYPSPLDGAAADDAVARVSRRRDERRDERRRAQNSGLESSAGSSGKGSDSSSSGSSGSSSEARRLDQRGAAALRAGRAMSLGERRAHREAARRMFVHAYDGYMYHAYPHGELAPLSCSGQAFGLVRVPAVTLIDALDTLLVLGNRTEFRRAVGLVAQALPHGFDLDVNVSVFETTIRLLGGLLSAHQLATDPILDVYPQGGGATYDGSLLTLALDLGERLLPAFATPTGIPYGTVNLRHGVPRGETPVASLAGAGSLTLEFTLLSHLSGVPAFGAAAQAAALALHARRTPLGLLGKHVHVRSGKWTESVSGLGSNADSYFEYLLKMYLLFGDPKWWWAFVETVESLDSHLRRGDWFIDADAYSGQPRRQRFENLMAFWPGVQALAGDLAGAVQSLNAFCLVWRDWGFLPEEYDYGAWQLSGTAMYPLRPELVESIYLVRRATGDDSWLWAGAAVLESLAKHTGTSCGHAVVKNVATLELDDTMPSFFLAETAKYLYLLFDDENWVHDRPFVFTTEAHPFLLTPQPRPPPTAEAAAAGAALAAEVAAEVVADTTAEAGGGDQEASDEASDEAEEDEDASPEDVAWRVEARRLGRGAAATRKGRAAQGAAPAWPPPSLRGPVERPPVGALTLQSKVPHWLAELGFDAEYEDALGNDQVRRPTSPPGNAEDRRTASRFGHAFNDLPWHAKDAQDAPEQRREAQSTWSDAPAAETVGVTTLSMGDLGTFQVSVFTDGFLVENLDDGETLEIANIGSGVVSVVNARPFNRLTRQPAASRAVASNLHSQRLVCTVGLDLSGSSSSSSSGGEHADDTDVAADADAAAADAAAAALAPLSLAALSNLPCAVSGFGRSLDAAPSPPVSGAVHFSAIDPTGCKDPPPAAETAETTETTGSHSWSNARPPDPPAAAVAAAPRELEGRVALLQRGDCMFEHKARRAEQKGAAAVVVVNSEYGQRFIMSGQTGATTTPPPPAEGTAEAAALAASNAATAPVGVPAPAPVGVPVVMVAREHGELLAAAAERLAAQGLPAKLTVHVAKQPRPGRRRSGSTEAEAAWPTVRVAANSLQVLGMGEWGAFLSSPSGKDWQLFVIRKQTHPAPSGAAAESGDTKDARAVPVE